METKYWSLRFPDQSTAESLLKQTINDIGSECVVDKYINIVWIGTIYREIDGELVPTSGYHIDIATQGDLPSELMPYKIPFPKDPKHKWQML